MPLREDAVARADDPPDMGIGEAGDKGIVGLNGHTEGLVAGVDELGESGQRHDGAAELAPVRGRAVAFFTPVDVERTHEGGALSAVVVES